MSQMSHTPQQNITSFLLYPFFVSLCVCAWVLACECVFDCMCLYKLVVCMHVARTCVLTYMRVTLKKDDRGRIFSEAKSPPPPSLLSDPSCVKVPPVQCRALNTRLPPQA